MMYVQYIDVKIVEPYSVVPEHVSWCGDTEAMGHWREITRGHVPCQSKDAAAPQYHNGTGPN